jgi:hypothetical protein
MKADITRSTFQKKKHYSKVNMQQGKVLVDADWNEELDIQRHHERTFLQDIIGKTGTPIEDPGFEVVPLGRGYAINKGRYYVDGILCENNDQVAANKQEDLPDFSDLKNRPFRQHSPLPKTNGLYVVYLDVWQRHITPLEDSHIREVALGGTDTATRLKTVWQAKVVRLDKGENENDGLDEFEEHKKGFLSSGKLQARSKPEPESKHCKEPPQGGYTGDENRLYRVEIHIGSEAEGPPLFKWSRENGAVVAQIAQVKDDDKQTQIIVNNAGKDDRTRFQIGQWIEVIDDYHELWNIPGMLTQILDIHEETMQNQTVLKVAQDDELQFFDPKFLSPQNITKVRRWDWKTVGSTPQALFPVAAGAAADDGFLELEDGVQVKFQGNRRYVAGDYWLIPARTVPRDVEWPPFERTDGKQNPEWLPSMMKHHYCPLALIRYAGGKVEVMFDYRHFFSAATDHMNLYYVGGDGQDVKQETDNNALPFELVAGVAIGGFPLSNAILSESNAKTRFWKPQVLFEVVDEGEGTLAGGKTGKHLAEIDSQGLAKCTWTLDEKHLHQKVQATLIGRKDSQGEGKPFGLPLLFSASLPISFYYVCGDGHEITPENVFVLEREAEVKQEVKEPNYKRKEAADVSKQEMPTAAAQEQRVASDMAPASPPTKEAEPPQNQEQPQTTLALSEAKLVEFEKEFVKSPILKEPVLKSPREREAMPFLLSVGAKIGSQPLVHTQEEKFVVRFEVVRDANVAGWLRPLREQKRFPCRAVDVPLGADGTAKCEWAFSTRVPKAEKRSVSPGEQRVKATLMVLRKTAKTEKSAFEEKVVETQLPPQELRTKEAEKEVLEKVALERICTIAGLAKTELPPIYFNATFAEPCLEYLCDSREKVKRASAAADSLKMVTVHQLVAGVVVEGVPLPLSMKPLWRVQVRFATRRGGSIISKNNPEGSEANVDVNEIGVATCYWKLGEDPAKESAVAQLVDPNSEALGLPLLFLAKNSESVSATTGRIRLNLQPAEVTKSGQIISDVIRHSLDCDVPPAIMLGLLLPTRPQIALEKNSLKAVARLPSNQVAVDHFEDYCFYEWAYAKDGRKERVPIFPRFKAVDVTTEGFRLLMEPPFPPPDLIWYVQWWAVPAQQQPDQDAFLKPRLTVLDADGKNAIRDVSTGVPFTVTLEYSDSKDDPVEVAMVFTRLSEKVGNKQAAILKLPEKPQGSKVFTAKFEITDDEKGHRVLQVNDDGSERILKKFDHSWVEDESLEFVYSYVLRVGFPNSVLTNYATLHLTAK